MSQIDQTMIDRIADAIDGTYLPHSMTLIRLVDGVSTYRVTINGETKEFTDNDDENASEQAHAFIKSVRQRRQAEAIVAALNKKGDAP